MNNPWILGALFGIMLAFGGVSCQYLDTGPEHCFSCEYSLVGFMPWYRPAGYGACSLQTYRDFRAVDKPPCPSGVCYIRTERDGRLIRGCVDFSSLPRGVTPRSECQYNAYTGTHIWFCQGNLCNTGSLGNGLDRCKGKPDPRPPVTIPPPPPTPQQAEKLHIDNSQAFIQQGILNTMADLERSFESIRSRFRPRPPTHYGTPVYKKGDSKGGKGEEEDGGANTVLKESPSEEQSSAVSNTVPGNDSAVPEKSTTVSGQSTTEFSQQSSAVSQQISAVSNSNSTVSRQSSAVSNAVPENTEPKLNDNYKNSDDELIEIYIEFDDNNKEPNNNNNINTMTLGEDSSINIEIPSNGLSSQSPVHIRRRQHRIPMPLQELNLLTNQDDVKAVTEEESDPFPAPVRLSELQQAIPMPLNEMDVLEEDAKESNQETPFPAPILINDLQQAMPMPLQEMDVLEFEEDEDEGVSYDQEGNGYMFKFFGGDAKGYLRGQKKSEDTDAITVNYNGNEVEPAADLQTSDANNIDNGIQSYNDGNDLVQASNFGLQVSSSNIPVEIKEVRDDVKDVQEEPTAKDQEVVTIEIEPTGEELNEDEAENELPGDLMDDVEISVKRMDGDDELKPGEDINIEVIFEVPDDSNGDDGNGVAGNGDDRNEDYGIGNDGDLDDRNGDDGNDVEGNGVDGNRNDGNDVDHNGNYGNGVDSNNDDRNYGNVGRYEDLNLLTSNYYQTAKNAINQEDIIDPTDEDIVDSDYHEPHETTGQSKPEYITTPELETNSLYNNQQKQQLPTELKHVDDTEVLLQLTQRENELHDSDFGLHDSDLEELFEKDPSLDDAPSALNAIPRLISVENQASKRPYGGLFKKLFSRRNREMEISPTANPCDGRCNENPSRLFPDLTRAEYFIQCGSGYGCVCCKPYYMRCPEGTLFDIRTSVCSATGGR